MKTFLTALSALIPQKFRDEPFRVWRMLWWTFAILAVAVITAFLLAWATLGQDFTIEFLKWAIGMEITP